MNISIVKWLLWPKYAYDAAMAFHLPLDGNYDDYSGLGRNAIPKIGYNAPRFTNLEQYLDGSAVFMGSECIEVSSML